jgi:hypothetical protein
MDARGYSRRVVSMNAGADQDLPGVKLGKFCMRRDIPVSFVSDYFGVSRMSVYKWFSGQWEPRKKHLEKIATFLKEYR